MSESAFAAGGAAPLDGVRVLVVDDEPAVARAIARLLVRSGCSVSEAHTGAEGLEAVRASAPDLVITDVNMPEMDGIEFLLALQDGNAGLPVIAMSGGGRVPRDSLLADATLLGAVEVLPKPFEPEELLTAVRRQLAR